MSCGVALAGQVRVRLLTALILLAFIACGLCSSTCECDTPQVRAVLIRFFNATGGVGWKRADRWTSYDPVCSWYGIECNGTDLTEIDLLDNNLTGTLTSDLANFTSIHRINLARNNLSGTLPPQWCTMAQVQELHLSINQLSGTLPPEWSEMRVQFLYLDANQFTGFLPVAWSAMLKIVHLYVDYNKLNGSLPHDWSAMQAQILYLNDNLIAGSLPPEWSAMPNIKHLNLANNLITGSLPPEWSKMSEIRELYFYNNRINGTLPPQWSNMPKLEQLGLNNNRISGLLPPEWSKMTKIDAIRLSCNVLTGSVPSEWSKMAQLRALDLSNNSFGGPLAPCDFPLWSTSFVINTGYRFINNKFRGRLQLACLRVDPCSYEYRDKLNDLVLKGNQLCGVCKIECQCDKTENTAIESPNLAIVRVSDSSECCSACEKHPLCVAAVYQRYNSRCELKNVTSPMIAMPYVDVLVPITKLS